MQQFVVPQFIDVEGKIIGPITTRQFVLMLVGGFMIFILFRLATFTVFLVLSVFIVFFVVVFGFVKVNGRPIHKFLNNVIRTLFGRPLLRAWQREIRVTQASMVTDVKKSQDISDDTDEPPQVRPLVRTRLSELSLVVDTGGVYNEEE